MMARAGAKTRLPIAELGKDHTVSIREPFIEHRFDLVRTVVECFIPVAFVLFR